MFPCRSTQYEDSPLLARVNIILLTLLPFGLLETESMSGFVIFPGKNQFSIFVPFSPLKISISANILFTRDKFTSNRCENDERHHKKRSYQITVRNLPLPTISGVLSSISLHTHISTVGIFPSYYAAFVAYVYGLQDWL